MESRTYKSFTFRQKLFKTTSLRDLDIQPAALRGIGTVLVLVVNIERDYRVLLAKRPPPAEAGQPGEHEAGVMLSSETLNEIQYRVQGFFRAPIVRTNANVAAEFEHCRFLAWIEGGLLEDHHPLGLAENVVVESALRDAVLGGRLGEAHLLGHYGLDRLLEIVPRPRGRLQLQQGRIVS